MRTLFHCLCISLCICSLTGCSRDKTLVSNQTANQSPDRSTDRSTAGGPQKPLLEPETDNATDAAPAPTPVGTLGVDSRGAYTEEKEICSETQSTRELHNVRCGESGLPCECIADKKWCFVATDFKVEVPNHRWVFSSPARVKCARDNDGSCGWNLLGAPDRFFVTLNNPTEIRARVLTNSHSIGVQVCADARYYP